MDQHDGVSPTILLRVTSGALRHPAAGSTLFLVPLLLAAALVTIRIYNYAVVPPAELGAAREAAGRILQDAGLAVKWEVCRVPNSAEGAACTEPLRDAGEFVLRLQTSA